MFINYAWSIVLDVEASCTLNAPNSQIITQKPGFLTIRKISQDLHLERRT